MLAFQGLRDLFAEESDPSPYKVAEGLADYFEGRRSYKDDLAVLDLLEKNGFMGPYKRAVSALPPPLKGATSGEKIMASTIGHLQIYLHLGSPADRQSIVALRPGC